MYLWKVILTLQILNVYMGYITDVNSEIVFVALTSKIIRPNSVQKVFISGEENGTTTKCTVTLTRYNATKAVATENLEIEPGKTVVASLALKDLPFQAYNLTIQTENSKEVNDRAILHVVRDINSIFIQTDKPIYKPGETVKIRIIVLDRKFRPLKEMAKVNISVSDPSRNLIKYWKDLEIKSNGMSKKTLELSSEPNLGDWIVKAEVGPQKTENTFNVAQYVLPKFKVEVKLPKFITFNNTKLIAEVSAVYTYGKPVNKGEFQVSLSDYLEYCSECSLPKISKTVPLNGNSTFVEFDVRKDLNISADQLYEKEFKVQATFTESITGMQQNGSATIKMYSLPYKVSMLNPPSSYKPGFPLNLTLEVLTQDDIPISDDDPNAVQISHGFSWDDEGGHWNSSITNGLVQLNFQTPTNEYIHIPTLQVKYKELTQDIYLPEKFTIPSKIYMQVYRLTNNIKINELLKLRVKANRVMKYLKSVLICRGEVVSMNVIPETIDGTMELEFSVRIPSVCNPKGEVIVYGVFSTKSEIIADSVTFDMGTILDNFLNISTSNTTIEPRSNITISLESKPNSTIALRGVDQSVLLLKQNKDVDIKAVDEIITTSASAAESFRIGYWGQSIHKIFDESGTVVLTNAKIDKTDVGNAYYNEDEEDISGKQDSRFFGRGSAIATTPYSVNAEFADAPQVRSLISPGLSQSQNIEIRTEFPETWIFDEINGTLDEGGVTSLLQTVPDTITSWIITGFSISANDGLGVSLNPTKITTFRPFFISLNLPYSVVQGEVLALQVLVHNYLEKELNVKISIDNDLGTLKYIEKNDPANNGSLTKIISAAPSKVSSVSFLVIPTSFGIKKLTVKAISEIAGDGVTQPLLVKPPGVKQLKNHAVLLDLRSEQKTFEKNLTASFPVSRVAGADSLKITVIGDMLGSTVSNLDKLLQLPTGCGEQNMLNFVVDIVVLNYLKSVSGLTSPIRNKALGYLEKGYQRQLTYLRYDGSFSAFGNHDEMGSTWLTAFVARYFIQAKPFITIDDNILMQSFSYLAKRQQPHGGFEELGRVHDTELLGGSGAGGLAISAYTVLAFIEASKSISNFNHSSVISKGLKYITSKNVTDAYAVNLIAYTLQIANHPKKNKFFDILESIAKQDGDLKYWEQKRQPKSNKTMNATMDDKMSFKRPWVIEPEPLIKPATVEMTAYALLTTLLQNKITESLPIARWLTTQRNDQGGFKSTQDTVVGVTALAKFGLITKTKDSNVKVNIQYLGGNKSLEIGDNNLMEVQEIALPEETRWVYLTSTGKGSALAQLSWSFYVEGGNSTSAFNLTVQSKDSGSPKKLWLTVCSAYNYPGKSNMALMEVELPTGFVFETERLEEIKDANVLRYETEDANTKLIIYYNQMTAEKKCVNLRSFLTYPVAKQAPAHVVLYDYYDTTKRATTSYEAPKISVCDICEYDNTCKVENCV